MQDRLSSTISSKVSTKNKDRASKLYAKPYARSFIDLTVDEPYTRSFIDLTVDEEENTDGKYPVHCMECHGILIEKKSLRSRGKNRTHCVACHHILSLTPARRDELYRWVLTGLLPLGTKITIPSPSFLERLSVQRKSSVNNRRNTGNHTVVTGLELLELYQKYNFRCALTGHVIHFTTSNEFWRLSFDHIVPLSLCYSEVYDTLKNLQPMSAFFNTLKGSYSNEDLQKWYDNFVRHIDRKAIERAEDRYLFPFYFDKRGRPLKEKRKHHQ